MKADLHGHTKYSFDAISSPRGYIKSAKRAGLDAIAVTDHDTVAAWKELSGLSKQYNIQVIFGEEIKARENGRKIGDIIGLFLTEAIRPSDPLTVIDKISQQGGLAVIPHPFDASRSFKTPELIKHADLIEVFNSRAFSNDANLKALEAAKKHKLGFSAGSDSHMLREIGRSYVISKSDDPEGLRKELLNGKVEISGRRSHVFVHAVSTIAKLRP
ncbi:MAG: PHP domain-containing protein [Candidatus Aenigmarchaeota archaeon]|nr:PHP domain-containing protein [Candidatus Aenigmarchaeota archaeon]